ncbi:MAG: hypothetical protein NXI30_12610 [bacterium]|nr:hypothetical protein [bacterium]
MRGTSSVALVIGILAFGCAGGHANRPAESGREAIIYSRLDMQYWQVWVFDVRDRTHRRLTTSGFDKRRPASDGRRVFFRDGNDRLFVLDLQSGGEAPFRPDLWPALTPRPSPTGRRLALARIRTDVDDRSAIVILDSDDASPRLVTPSSGFIRHYSWAPSGRELVYSSASAGSRAELFRVSLGSDPKPEAIMEEHSRALEPAAAPSGTGLLFSSSAAGNFDIWRRTRFGFVRRLTDSTDAEMSPSWSPTGEQIAYVRVQDGQPHVWKMSRAGEHQQPFWGGDIVALDPEWTILEVQP